MYDREYIKNLFKEGFSNVENKAIALYGLGITTKFIIESFPDYQFVALLDSTLNRGLMYGLPIVSLEKIPSMNVDFIIIVARTNSTKIIAKQVKSFCRKNDIGLYDINGNDLLKQASQKAVNNSYLSLSFDAIQKVILSNEVVCFDIFDTLLMRKTLYPEDVFLLLERKKNIRGFAKIRKQIEREFYVKGLFPTLDDIYSNLRVKLKMSVEELNGIKNAEVIMEEELLVPRYDMVKLFNIAVAAGKEVYLVSDMYLSEKVLKQILDAKGIYGYKKILVSSEYKTGKLQDLFDVLKQMAKKKNILHIGDDEDADQRSAVSHGISIAPIKSAVDMLEISTYGELINFAKNLDERLLLGMILSEVFNSPFALYNSEGKPTIDNGEKFGKTFIAPLMSAFMFWIIKNTQHMADIILWSARDGYLLLKMYERLKNKFSEYGLPRGVYFLTSRMATVSAMLKNTADIEYAASVPFSGTSEQMLAKRFLLEPYEILSRNANESQNEYVLRHKDRILNKSRKLRNNYRIYFKSLDINIDDRLAFFDLVSSGTCQMGLKHIVDNKINGFYFIFCREDYSEKQSLDVTTFIEEGRLYSLNSYFSENYEPTEKVIIPACPTLKCFDENGQPIFEKDVRTNSEIKYVNDVQEGVMKFWNDFLDIVPDIEIKISAELVDKMYSFMNDKCSYILNCTLIDTVFVDDFTNRQYTINGIFE